MGWATTGGRPTFRDDDVAAPVLAPERRHGGDGIVHRNTITEAATADRTAIELTGDLSSQYLQMKGDIT